MNKNFKILEKKNSYSMLFNDGSLNKIRTMENVFEDFFFFNHPIDFYKTEKKAKDKEEIYQKIKTYMLQLSLKSMIYNFSKPKNRQIEEIEHIIKYIKADLKEIIEHVSSLNRDSSKSKNSRNIQNFTSLLNRKLDNEINSFEEILELVYIKKELTESFENMKKSMYFKMPEGLRGETSNNELNKNYIYGWIIESILKEKIEIKFGDTFDSIELIDYTEWKNNPILKERHSMDLKIIDNNNNVHFYDIKNVVVKNGEVNFKMPKGLNAFIESLRHSMKLDASHGFLFNLMDIDDDKIEEIYVPYEKMIKVLERFRDNNKKRIKFEGAKIAYTRNDGIVDKDNRTKSGEYFFRRGQRFVDSHKKAKEIGNTLTFKKDDMKKIFMPINNYFEELNGENEISKLRNP